MEKKYATFWPRVLAAILDALILWPLDWAGELIWGATKSLLILVPWYLLHAFSFVAYTIVLHGLYGQTIGKAIMGVKVVDLSEGRLSMMQAVLRDSVILVITAVGVGSGLRLATAGISPYGNAFEMTAVDWVFIYATLGWSILEVLSMLLNEKRRAIHDYIAGSVVIRVERGARRAAETGA